MHSVAVFWHTKWFLLIVGLEFCSLSSCHFSDYWKEVGKGFGGPTGPPCIDFGTKSDAWINCSDHSQCSASSYDLNTNRWRWSVFNIQYGKTRQAEGRVVVKILECFGMFGWPIKISSMICFSYFCLSSHAVAFCTTLLISQRTGLSVGRPPVQHSAKVKDPTISTRHTMFADGPTLTLPWLAQLANPELQPPICVVNTVCGRENMGNWKQIKVMGDNTGVSKNDLISFLQHIVNLKTFCNNLPAGLPHGLKLNLQSYVA